MSIKHDYEEKIMNKDKIIELLDKYSIENEADEYLRSFLSMLGAGSDSFCVSTGYPSLDQYLKGGFHSGQLITIGARPSIGKTAFAISLIRNMLERDKKILFFSLEMSSKDIISRLVTGISGVSLHDISNNDAADEFPKVMSAVDYLYDKSLYIVDIPNISIEALLDITRAAVTEKHVNCILIDHFRLIKGIEFSLDKYERATRKLKELAMWMNIPIITMFQFSRDSDQREPSLEEISCTADSLDDDSDVVLFLHRHRSQNKDEQCSIVNKDKGNSLQVAKVIIAKNKNGDTGHALLGFNGSTTAFENIETI